MSIISGSGTPGVEVFLGLAVFYSTGEFYACNATLPYRPAIAIYYREADEEAPERCSDVLLQSHYLYNETMHEFQRDSWCKK